MHSRMGDWSRIQTDFLFAQPSFLSGVARVLDLFGTFDEYNVSPTPAEADYRALRSDWAKVGQDLQAAMNDLEAAALSR